MTEFSISLPKVNNKIPKVSEKAVSKDIEIALSAFDSDGVKGLNDIELLEAFDYFVNKEKNVAVVGKKGDNVITSKDIEEIIKTDPKFLQLKNQYNNDNEVVDLLSRAVIALSALVQINNRQLDAKLVEYIGLETMQFMKEDYTSEIANNQAIVDNTQSELIDIAGQKVYICHNNKGENFVKSADGKIIDNPDIVAKYLGYETNSFLFMKKYYTTNWNTSLLQNSNNSVIRIADEYKQYKIWDAEKNCFTNGRKVFTGLRKISGNSK